VQKDGSLFAASSYLKRAVDYRSVLGEIIRDHLGATQAQLNRIIPGYANESAYKLKNGGVVVYKTTNTPTTGELGLI
jgi:hypothetical protein